MSRSRENKSWSRGKQFCYVEITRTLSRDHEKTTSLMSRSQGEKTLLCRDHEKIKSWSRENNLLCRDHEKIKSWSRENNFCYVEIKSWSRENNSLCQDHKKIKSWSHITRSKNNNAWPLRTSVEEKPYFSVFWWCFSVWWLVWSWCHLLHPLYQGWVLQQDFLRLCGPEKLRTSPLTTEHQLLLGISSTSLMIVQIWGVLHTCGANRRLGSQWTERVGRNERKFWGLLMMQQQERTVEGISKHKKASADSDERKWENPRPVEVFLQWP